MRNQESRKVKVSTNAQPASTSTWSEFLAPTETASKPNAKAASAWGDFSFDEEGTDASVDALTALLEERDLLLADKVVEKKATSNLKATHIVDPTVYHPSTAALLGGIRIRRELDAEGRRGCLGRDERRRRHNV